ncbi:ABC transporter substrate-binding protein [Geobacter sp. AOG2]|uniref:ABC transporter substrate-binding protein n=1 Tax=Geobacter sp. AOG2 TaxID=1566347 RepID=UPI001CC7F2C7|nr:ABC transporter substrate-binding protein [Geobacter sp. AOG2]GFE61165.1 cytochrome c [Geobacter sp. AOG2]
MKDTDRYRRFGGLAVALLFGTFFSLFTVVPGSFGETAKPALSNQERLHLGEQMYREGLLPSGEPMRAYVKGDLPVPGTAFTCVSCHLRSGLGSVEGGVFTPPTNGDKLFQPFQLLFKGLEQKYFPLPPRRPAYNDETLAEVIRSGATPTGKALNDVMPRYLLDDGDMALLIYYLKELSAHYSPGVTTTALHFATVITDEVSPEDRNAMLAPLELYISIKNNQAKAYKTQGNRSRQMAENMLVSKELATRNLTLSRWVLKGPPDTWRKQLEDYNRKEPVFALLGGISYGDWKPIHDFSEQNHIPCLFPMTNLPVISETDWYTLYPSKGYYQEGETAARYLHAGGALPKGASVVQIVRDSPEGRALAAGFRQTWLDSGHPAPKTVTLKAGQAINGNVLRQAVTKKKPRVIMVWDGGEAVPALQAFAASGSRPALLFVSARYLGKNLWTLPDQIRPFTYITYPYTFSLNVTYSSMGSATLQDDQQKTLSQANILIKNKAQEMASLGDTLTQILTMALMDLKGNYYRDNLLDVIGMIADQPSSVFGRLSFGPGQRYASKGCNIVKLTKGLTPELVKQSDWVIH